MLHLPRLFRALIALLALSALAPVMAQDRHALVIGNSRYEHADPLRNAGNDAQLIARSLRQIGFKVELLQDATLTQMIAAATTLGRRLGRGDIAFVYFAGHGVQHAGDNYLIPVDATVERPE